MAQAQIKDIDASLLLPVFPIEIFWNSLTADIVPAVRTSGKYKKVTIESKHALLGLVRNGSSIISVFSPPYLGCPFTQNQLFYRQVYFPKHKSQIDGKTQAKTLRGY
jgi:hypothetical protein